MTDEMEDEAVDLKLILKELREVKADVRDMLATVNNLLGVSEQNLEATNQLTEAIRPRPEERDQFKSLVQEALGEISEKIDELPERVADALDEPVE